MPIQPSAVSLLISTYNRPDALALVLKSVRAQRALPGEVVIADDGSGEETRALIEREAATFPVPLVHIWHEDTGFRLAAIRNKAIAASKGSYIVQIDGDIILHRELIGAHARFAQSGSWVQGSRALLGPQSTESLLRGAQVSYFTLLREMSGRINALYLPFLTRWISGPQDATCRVRGAHMAFWRDDLVRVNGYNEEIEGWGREDTELVTRLCNAGIRRRNIKFSAVSFHLWHKTAPADQLKRNESLLRISREQRLAWADRGLNQYLKPKQAAT